jgi:hypothetical protein
MFRPSRIRGTVLLLLALALWGPLLATAEAGGVAEPAGSRGFDPWRLAAQLWTSLSGLWDENGCSLDPDGRCAGGVAGAATESLDEGCSVDPDGRCDRGAANAATESLDEGCSLDPSGRCR